MVAIEVKSGSAEGDVVSFDRATIVAPERGHTGLWAVDLTIGRGGLALVFADGSTGAGLLADACTGLARPVSGTVRFLGNDWGRLTADRACALRGRTSRVFDAQNWINYASIGDNMMMSALHHTRRPRREVLREAAILAREFGLPGLPTSRASGMLAADLQRAACARAFIGEADLVILENPTRGVYPAIMGPLVNGVRRVRERGGAVLWITDRDEIWNNRAIRPTMRARLAGSQLVRTDG